MLLDGGGQPGDTSSKALSPAGHCYAIRCFYTAFVKKRVMRPSGRCGILGGGNRLDRTGAANDLFDGKGKLIPADPAFVAVVINTRHPTGRGDDMQDH